MCADHVAEFERFAAQLPEARGFACIVAHDLDEAALAAALERARAAGAVGIALASAGEAVRVDSVRVAPSGMRIGVAGGAITLAPRDREATHPVDDCLGSIAACGERGAAVLLCPPASDGLRGARLVKEAGGLVVMLDLAQAASSAPTEAPITAIADLVIPAADMPRALAAYAKLVAAEEDPAAVDAAVPIPDIDQVIALIRGHTGVDFADYKKSTLVRRVQRRMAVHQAESITEYVELLRQSPDEIGVLFRELLIGVTRFFRDEEAFQVVREKILPQLLKRDQASEPVRLWIAGCSSGEEAYSYAILVREALEELGRPLTVKIFATDLDRAAVEHASHGLYPSSIVADVSRARLHNWFVRKGDHWQIAKVVREMVIFAPHNLVQDPPFYKIDLISCRNLLIYLQPKLQRKLLTTFHFALNPNGWLVLGTSETLGELGTYFTTVSSSWKIYQKKIGKRLPLVLDGQPVERLRPPAPAARASASKPATILDDQIQTALTETILQECMPASLLVNEAFEIVHVYGQVDRYLTLPIGKPTFNLLKMAPRELSVALGTGIRKALKDGDRVVYQDVVGQGESVRLVIRPLIQRKDIGNFVLVVFEEATAGDAGAAQQFDLAGQSSQRVRDLEIELEQTSESLQAAIEELETSNEELQATNEEVLAANEELQSTNEELQSVNEELYTLNSEYQAKIVEQTELANDLLNFLTSTSIGTMFLDHRLNIRKFTPAITQQINVIDKDIGRPLEHLSDNLVDAGLVTDAAEVLRTLAPKQKEVAGKNGTTYLMRVMPYRTEDNVIKGVVLTFIDVTDVKMANENVRRLSETLERSAEQIMITRADGVIAYVNQRFSDVTGYGAGEVVGRTTDLLASERQGGADAGEPWAKVERGGTWEGFLTNRRKDGSVFREKATIIAMRDVDGRVVNFLKSSLLVDGR
ncbi:MAG TPA: CheR family methyltransferase [Planctomycetota bacterium]|nr:CheR family methyltransferase [Planctomycetota bacterium]